MKNSSRYIIVCLILFLISSCHKDPTGNPITIDLMSNIDIPTIRLQNSCNPAPYYITGWEELALTANETSYFSVEDYSSNCFFVTGTIPASTDTVGTTTVSINAYYTEEGNVVGFQDIEMKRPHGEHKIKYEFRADTYLE